MVQTIEKMNNWEKQLEYYRLQQLAIDGNTYTTLKVTEMMQKKFPGPYIVKERYNSQKGRFEYVLVFNDNRQELFWKLKWS